MKFACGALVALAALAAPAGAVTPVQKVIQMLETMLQKGKSEKHAEQVQYASYKQFCDDTATEKQRSVKEAGEKIDVLKADISKYDSDSTTLTQEIAGHDEDVAVWTGDMKAAMKVREIEGADYTAMHKDYSESIDALQRAIALLKKQAANAPSSLAQVAALKQLNLIPKEAKRVIDLFLAQDADDAAGLAAAAPQPAPYEFQSRGVIELLEKLEDKFVDERTELEKKEMNAKHAYELLQQDLKAQVDQATQDRGEKAGMKAKKLQAKADSAGDLDDTTATQAADKKYLSDLTATCQQKASDFTSRQQLRAEELLAIGKAIEILNSAAITGNADKYLPAMMQKGTALASLRSEPQGKAQARAAEYVRTRAHQLESRVLSALAVRMSDDPFGKVKKMIKDLLVRLMEEANEEAEHKGWCDTELATNEQTRKEKTAAVDTLHAELDQLDASIAKLTEEVSQLSKAVADLDVAMSTSTKDRQAEKATNAQTVKDAQEAQTALAQAITVLSRFYSSAGQATAMVQRQAPPAIFDSPYQGMQAENGGVIGMLQVIESDFARLEAETASSEALAQKQYDTFMTDSQVDKATKTKDIEHKQNKIQEESQAETAKKSDLAGTQKELDAAIAYFDKLKPSCVDTGVSYDDRVTRRKEEIASLQEALRILNGEDIAA